MLPVQVMICVFFSNARTVSAESKHGNVDSRLTCTEDPRREKIVEKEELEKGERKTSKTNQ